MKKSKISFSVKSPCINVCRIDSENNTCLGCGRNIKEISHWINMNNKEKGKLLLSLKNRVNKE
jgi:uncharacterized protein